MHWEVLIIPLIALGVWIFSTLFKSEDDKVKKGVGRLPPFPPQNGGGRGGGRAPGRRIVTDLDRFLEEARRRREPEDQRKAPPPTRTPVPRPPLRERPTRPKESPRIATPVIVKEEVAGALPAPRPRAQPPIAEPVAVPLQQREASPPPAPATRTSPIAQQARSLLSMPQSAATAFVLREIFDGPLCKRRRS